MSSIAKDIKHLLNLLDRLSVDWYNKIRSKASNSKGGNNMKTTDNKQKTQTLAQYLLNQRSLKKMTLREVEEATNHNVSNAYLSQLEHNKIAKPSPNILHNLSLVYSVPYEVLMEKAGYIMETNNRQTGKHGRIATFANESLTEEEEETLLEYLVFLRSRKK